MARAIFAKGGRDYRRCAICGLVVVSPVPTAEEREKFYERDYTEETGGGTLLAAQEEMARSTARHRLQLIRRWTKGTRLLDAGCSTGVFLDVASQAGMDAEGIDLSAPAVAMAVGKGLKAQATTMERFAPAVPYDVVTGFDMIEHVPDPVLFLRSVHKVLKPDGILALTTPDTGSFSCWMMGRAWHLYIPRIHIVHFNRSNLAMLLEREGFTVIHVSGAWKSLTYNYALAMLDRQNPVMSRIWKFLGFFIPRSWRNRVFSIPIGEMMVIATSRFYREMSAANLIIARENGTMH